MIAKDLSKQQAFDIDPKAIQQIKLIENLEQDGNTTLLFIIGEAKVTVLEWTLFKRNRENIVTLFCFNIISLKMIQYNVLND